jgi:signal transduction histidine kinase
MALTSSALTRRLLWLAPLGLLLGALFAWGTARSVRQPVARLSAAAERMAAGDLETPMPGLPGDEIGRLGRVLERVRQTLGASVEAIEATNERLEQQVRDRTRELEQLCDRLEHRDRWRGEVLRRVISAQEDERRRLARELHDEVCQVLAALSVSLGAALEGVTAPEARQRLAAVGVLVDRSLADLHRMIYDLRPSILDDLGLVPAIRWLAQEHLTRHGTVARCEFEGLDRRLAPEVETAVFRVVQEGLMNVERPAHAETVLVQAAVDGTLLTVEIEDDGVGFDPAGLGAPTAQGRGLGLLGMRERVELLGGSLLVESTPGQGTRVVVSVPTGITDAGVVAPATRADEERRTA